MLIYLHSNDESEWRCLNSAPGSVFNCITTQGGVIARYKNMYSQYMYYSVILLISLFSPL
jgi:hypothetical protein